MATEPSSSLIEARPRILSGIAGSPGLAIGPALVLDARRLGVVHRRIKKHLADDEMARFQQAVGVAAQELRDVADRVRTSAARAESSILEAYILMVEDEMLRVDVERRIHIDLQCAEWALEGAVSEMADQLSRASDAYLAERGHDFQFVGDRIQRALAGYASIRGIPKLTEPQVIVAHDLSPAETAGLTRDQVLALVTEVGTRTSHTSILARALEIPAVVGVRGLLDHVGTGDVVIADGLRGRITVSPSTAMVASAEDRAAKRDQHARHLRELRDLPAVTRCGVPITLRANIELPSEAEIAMELGARGIGLYRTEFLYVDRYEPPSEDEQYETYRKVLEAVGPQPVTLRTFDIGGDKFSSALQLPSEMNPALGLRAVRLGLAQPELFLTQLRAMLRASAHGELRIMVPMVASISELRAVRVLLDEARESVIAAGQQVAARIPLGAMVEVPAAAIMADELAREAEFLSVGTNDLVQYALAVDRTSQALAYLASYFDPAILRLVRLVIEAGAKHERSISVCGAMASDPMASLVLVGMGLRELSLEASAIPVVKAALRRVTLSDAEALAERTRECATAEEVESVVCEAVGDCLDDLIAKEEDDQ